ALRPNCKRRSRPAQGRALQAVGVLVLPWFRLPRGRAVGRPCRVSIGRRSGRRIPYGKPLGARTSHHTSDMAVVSGEGLRLPVEPGHETDSLRLEPLFEKPGERERQCPLALVWRPGERVIANLRPQGVRVATASILAALLKGCLDAREVLS